MQLIATALPNVYTLIAAVTVSEFTTSCSLV